jgi:hypothetical protein
MNWILNKCDAAARYIMAAGISAYDANEDYVVGDTVRAPTDGKCYECILANGHAAAKEPHVNPTYWSRWGHTDDDINKLLPVVAVDDETTGIATTGASPGTITDPWMSQTGGAKIVQRCTFKLTMSTIGVDVVTFSGIKAFRSRITNVQVSGNSTGTGTILTGHASITSENVIQVVGSIGGANYFVTVEGY